MSAFVITALPLAGGILAISPQPGMGRQYAADLDHIRDWKPALVVSMTTTAELNALGAGTLGPDLQDAGTRWAHFPLEDYCTPTPEQEEEWHAISRIALAALQGGGRVLIHCRSGCGRSGMAALRLMVEAGEPAGDALTRLRSLRPCAVETDDQMVWAREVH